MKNTNQSTYQIEIWFNKDIILLFLDFLKSGQDSYFEAIEKTDFSDNNHSINRKIN